MRLPVPSAAPRREAGRIVRFCVVGAANSAITLAAFVGLVALGVPAPAASALAFGAGAANSYVVNRRWTFADLPAAGGAWLRFAGLQGGGALLSAAGVSALQSAGWAHMPAECAVLPGVTVTLYCLSRLLVFRSVA
jgi:putative flippase GtrA